MLKVIHIITGLGIGGAEMMLYKLLSSTNRNEIASTVVSLSDNGPMGDKIKDLGIEVICLGMRRGVPSLTALTKLVSLIRGKKPHLVQTWMYHSDLLGGIAAKFVKNTKIVWGIHHSNLDFNVNKGRTILTAKLCAFLSRYIPDKIISCSHVAEMVHIKFGYIPHKIKVIPNGFDQLIFCPDKFSYISVRENLGLNKDNLLVGLIGRYHPQKDHINFINAISMLPHLTHDVKFIMCGEGISCENLELSAIIKKYGLQQKVLLLGPRDDIPRIMASLDILVSSSCGEGFPNVIGEAMSCGVPCIVTNVGDSGWLVGDTGMVVPPRNPLELSTALHKMIMYYNSDERQELGRRARQRIINNFSLGAVSKQYEELYYHVIAEQGV